MVDDDKALKWLDDVIGQPVCFAGERQHARRIREMLARPVLPEKMDSEMVQIYSRGGVVEPRDTHRALYAHLTAPKTKEVEVWRVEGAQRDVMNHRWVPSVMSFNSEDAARSYLEDCQMRGSWRFAAVTGPHKQTVPAT